MKIKIIEKKLEKSLRSVYTFTDVDADKVICFVWWGYITDKWIDMIKKYNGDLSIEFFDNLAEEQIGAFRHIYAVSEYIKNKWQTLYSIYYDTHRDCRITEHNDTSYDDLTIDELKKIVDKWLESPSKDIKIVSSDGHIYWFSYSPSWENVKAKLWL